MKMQKKKLKLVFVSEQITLKVGTNEWHKAKKNEPVFFTQKKSYIYCCFN